MIKKILATVCAIGLMFASCFVGHKIDSKAEIVGIPNSPDYDTYLTLINGQRYAPFFDFTLISQNSQNSVAHCSILILVTRSNDGTNPLIKFGGGFALMYSFAAANPSKYTSCFTATYSNSFDCNFYDGAVPTSYFSWSTWNSVAQFPQIASGTFTPSSSFDASGFYLSLYTANSSQTVTFSFPLSGISAYVPSSRDYSTWVTSGSKLALNKIFVSQNSLGGTIYTENQYQLYGQQQYNQGQQVGYNEGYSAGISDGDNNSFLSLITAVVDAPVKAFTSLLNFDILGFNVKNVVLSLLTAALVIACIRFFSGKFT